MANINDLYGPYNDPNKNESPYVAPATHGRPGVGAAFMNSELLFGGVAALSYYDIIRQYIKQGTIRFTFRRASTKEPLGPVDIIREWTTALKHGRFPWEQGEPLHAREVNTRTGLSFYDRVPDSAATQRKKIEQTAANDQRVNALLLKGRQNQINRLVAKLSVATDNYDLAIDGTRLVDVAMEDAWEKYAAHTNTYDVFGIDLGDKGKIRSASYLALSDPRFLDFYEKELKRQLRYYYATLKEIDMMESPGSETVDTLINKGIADRNAKWRQKLHEFPDPDTPHIEVGLYQNHYVLEGDIHPGKLGSASAQIMINQSNALTKLDKFYTQRGLPEVNKVALKGIIDEAQRLVSEGKLANYRINIVDTGDGFRTAEIILTGRTGSHVVYPFPLENAGRLRSRFLGPIYSTPVIRDVDALHGVVRDTFHVQARGNSVRAEMESVAHHLNMGNDNAAQRQAIKSIGLSGRTFITHTLQELAPGANAAAASRVILAPLYKFGKLSKQTSFLLDRELENVKETLSYVRSKYSRKPNVFLSLDIETNYARGNSERIPWSIGVSAYKRSGRKRIDAIAKESITIWDEALMGGHDEEMIEGLIYTGDATTREEAIEKLEHIKRVGVKPQVAMRKIKEFIRKTGAEIHVTFGGDAFDWPALNLFFEDLWTKSALGREGMQRIDVLMLARLVGYVSDTHKLQHEANRLGVRGLVDRFSRQLHVKGRAHMGVYDTIQAMAVLHSYLGALEDPAVQRRLSDVLEAHQLYGAGQTEALLGALQEENQNLVPRRPGDSIRVGFLTDLTTGAQITQQRSEFLSADGLSPSTPVGTVTSIESWKRSPMLKYNAPERQTYQLLRSVPLTHRAFRSLAGREYGGRALPYIGTEESLSLILREKHPIYLPPHYKVYLPITDLGNGARRVSQQVLYGVNKKGQSVGPMLETIDSPKLQLEYGKAIKNPHLYKLMEYQKQIEREMEAREIGGGIKRNLDGKRYIIKRLLARKVKELNIQFGIDTEGQSLIEEMSPADFKFRFQPARIFVPTYFDYKSGEVVTIHGEGAMNALAGVKFRSGSSKEMAALTYDVSHIGSQGQFDRAYTSGGVPVNIHHLSGFDAYPIQKGHFGTMFVSWGNQLVHKMINDGSLRAHQELLEEMGLEVQTRVLPFWMERANRYGKPMAEDVAILKDETKFRDFMSDPKKIERAFKAVNLTYTPWDIQKGEKELNDLYETTGLKDVFGAPRVGSPRLGHVLELTPGSNILPAGQRFWAGLLVMEDEGIIDNLGFGNRVYSHFNMPKAAGTGIPTRGIRFSSEATEELERYGLVALSHRVGSYALKSKKFVREYQRTINSLMDASFFAQNIPGLHVIKAAGATKGQLLPYTENTRSLLGVDRPSLFEAEVEVANKLAPKVFWVNDVPFPTEQDAFEYMDRQGIADSIVRESQLHADSLLVPSQLRGTIWDPRNPKMVNAPIRLDLPSPIELSYTVGEAQRTVRTSSLYIPGEHFRKFYEVGQRGTDGMRMYFRTTEATRVMNTIELALAFSEEYTTDPRSERTRRARKALTQHLTQPQDRAGRIGYLPWLANQYASHGKATEMLTSKVAGIRVRATPALAELTETMFPDWTKLKSAILSNQAIDFDLPKRGQRSRAGFSPIDIRKARALFEELQDPRTGLKTPKVFFEMAGGDWKQASTMWREYLSGRRFMPVIVGGHPQLARPDKQFARTVMTYVTQDLQDQRIGVFHHVDMSLINRDFDGDEVYIIGMQNIQEYKEARSTWIRDNNPQTLKQSALEHHKIAEIELERDPAKKPSRSIRALIKTLMKEHELDFTGWFRDAGELGQYSEEDAIIPMLKRIAVAKAGTRVGPINEFGKRIREAARYVMRNGDLSIGQTMEMTELVFGRVGELEQNIISAKKLVKTTGAPLYDPHGKIISAGTLERNILGALQTIQSPTSQDFLLSQLPQHGFSIFSDDPSVAKRQISLLARLQSISRENIEARVIGGIKSTGSYATEKRIKVLDKMVSHKLDPQIGGVVGIVQGLVSPGAHVGLSEPFQELFSDIADKERLAYKARIRLNEAVAHLSESRGSRLSSTILLGLAVVAGGALITPAETFLPQRPGTHPDDMRVGKSELPAWASLANPPVTWTRKARITQHNPILYEKMMASANYALPTYDNILYTPLELRPSPLRARGRDNIGYRNIYNSWTERNRNSLVNPIIM